MADEPRDLIAEFEENYRLVEDPARRRVERRVIGADYGATSYTTMDQVAGLADLLDLGRGRLVLDLGSGAGWPGIELGRSTGSTVVLTDVPLAGLRIAADRMQSEGVAGAVIAASGDALPLRDATVDAITASDVFC